MFDLIKIKIDVGIKDLLVKIAGPTCDEVGYLLRDKIRQLRQKNLVNILLKAREKLNSQSLPTQEVPLKILLPILENASLEDQSEILKEQWAGLLASAATKSKAETAYPKILSELSEIEVKVLNKIFEWYKSNNIPKNQWPVYGCFREYIIQDLEIKDDEFELCADNLIRLRLCGPVSKALKEEDKEIPIALIHYKAFYLTSLGHDFVLTCKGP